MTTRFGIPGRSALRALLGAVAAVLLLAGPAAAALEATFGNGIRATIVTADELRSDLKAADDTYELDTPHGRLTLGGDVTTLQPFPIAQVERALAGMRGFTTDVQVRIYLLPGMPTATGGSFARQDAIFLAPSNGPVAESTVAWITTHEMGHVLTWYALDGRPARWAAYMQARGLDPVLNGPTAPHAARAREILAEDIRYLYGGPEATRHASIENRELALPDRVAGLEPMLTGFLSDGGVGTVSVTANAYPNPCNPMTTIVMNVPGTVSDGSRARLRVFDVRGALVRTIDGGTLGNGRVRVAWNGTTDAGRSAPSGRYMYVMTIDGLTARGSVSLVR